MWVAPVYHLSWATRGVWPVKPAQIIVVVGSVLGPRPNWGRSGKRLIKWKLKVPVIDLPAVLQGKVSWSTQPFTVPAIKNSSTCRHNARSDPCSNRSRRHWRCTIKMFQGPKCIRLVKVDCLRFTVGIATANMHLVRYVVLSGSTKQAQAVLI